MISSRSSVTFGDSFDFVLLSHSLRVGSWSLGGVDDLVTEALGKGLNGTECILSGTLADQVDCLVDPSEWGNIDSLSTDDTT